MGLEMTELCMWCEDNYGIVIDGEANSISTVGDLHQYIASKVENRVPYRCLTVPVFFSLRQALAARLQRDPKGITLDTDLRPDLPLLCGKYDYWYDVQQTVPFPLPALANVWPRPLVCLFSLSLGLPVSLILGRGLLLYMGENSLFLGITVLFGSFVLPVIATYFAMKFLDWASLHNLPSVTVREVVQNTVKRIGDATQADGSFWTSDTVWTSLRSRVALMFDVEESRITKDTDFVKDLGAG